MLRHFRLVFLHAIALIVSVLLGFLVENTEQLTVYDCSAEGTLNRTLNIYYAVDRVAFVTGIRGISTGLSKRLLFISEEEQYRICIRDSFLDLYDENGTLIEADRCSADFFESLPIQYFNHLTSDSLVLEMNSNRLNRPICPYLFKNSDILTLTFSDYGRSFLYDNKMKFYEIRNPNNLSVDLRAQICFLQYDRMYRNVFKRDSTILWLVSVVQGVVFSGAVAFFEKDFFVDFTQVSVIEFIFDKIGEFFHASTNEWLANVFFAAYEYESREVMFDPASIESDDISSLRIESNYRDPAESYFYPDEDFCLFKHFPRTKLIFTRLQMLKPNNSMYSNSRETSCLYRFLSENNRYIDYLLYIRGQPPIDGASFTSAMLKECAIEERLSLCSNVTDMKHLSRLKPFVSFYEGLYAMKWIEFVGPVVTFPVFATSAFFLNLLVILVIRSKTNKKEKLFDNKSFRLIEMNSAFNCIECLIYQFRLMGICMGLNSIFCSSLRGTDFMFYFGSVDIYLSEAMKSCSMMTGLLFSLQRYVETSKIENKHLISFSNTSMLKLFSFVVGYGVVVSVPVVFDINLDRYNIDLYDSPGKFYLEDQVFSQQQPATIFYFLHYFINDFLILVLNLVVDCFLVREIKANLRQKAANKRKMEEVENQHAPSRDDKKRAFVERKANTMIILSIVIYLFCRVPELAGIIFLYINPRLIPSLSNDSCSINLFCYLLSNSIEYVYMLSYNFNLLLYYKFNKNFNQGFRKFLGQKKRQS